MAEGKTAAELMVDLLVDRWGVRHVFGLAGDGINGIIDALRKRKDDVQFIGVRHEETAALAAVGYAKFSGRLGVCLATSGPGAIHLLNGLYDAKLDQVPVLAITGMQYHDLIGTFYQQDVNTDRLMQDVAVYTERVMGPAHVENITNMAVRMALGHRSVAHISFPNDLQEKPVEKAEYSQMDVPSHTSAEWRIPHIIPTATDLQQAAEVLNAGRKVAIVVGAGALNARAEVEQLAETLGAPVAKAYLGKSVIPDNSPYTTGGMGVFGTKPTQEVFQNCDTLLMIGSSFPYIAYLPKPQGVRGVQIDIRPERIGLRFPVEVGLVGDAKETLRVLLPLLKRKEDRSFLESAQSSMREWRELLAQRAASDDMPMSGQVFAARLSEQLSDDAIICGDSGQNTFWLARNINVRGTQQISGSGTLATMASALPYAIGAQVAFPDRQVVAFCGDGGMAMLIAELSTCVKYKLPIKVFVAKNNLLGMIRWEQMMYLGHPEYAVELGDIDFVKVAEACGAQGYRVEEPNEVAETITQALTTPVPVLVEALVDPFEAIMPGQIKPEQAMHYAEALKKGQPNAERIALTLFRDAIEGFPQNREPLEKAFQEKAPDLPREGKDDQGTTNNEPEASFEAQRKGAPERR
ncbi:MAG TPA: thiamine pyrophosphate-dependent enzyme [Blastocatellia bacterium]|nr:thiamine pyrophosphate-dependent enzyme [Blastocatellia bacterium]